MHFGGLQKLSLIDYPGTMASVLFTAGCNFRCPYCHNGALVGDCSSPLLAWADVADFLQRRRGFLDGVVISGGEPTLHPDLMPVIARIKAMGFRVKLDTNGSRPKVLAGLLQHGLVDYVAMDLKTLPEWYPVYLESSSASVSGVRRSIDLLLDAGVAHEFRTTCVSPLIAREVIEALGLLIRGADCWVLQQVRLEHVLNPNFFNGMHPAPDGPQMRQFEETARPFVKRTEKRLIQSEAAQTTPVVPATNVVPKTRAAYAG